MTKNVEFIKISIENKIAISKVNKDNNFIINKNNSIQQVSIMSTFIDGNYDGIISIGQLKSNGDTGIGTFEGADGEMIVLDGVVYKAKADGGIEVVEDDNTTPFATINYFNEDKAISINETKDLSELTRLLDDNIKNRNNIYVVKIKGEFNKISLRSVKKQEKPYKEITEVIESSQRIFNYTNQIGTIVALYFPEYMDNLNVPGWHFHFLNDEKDKGGHVLDLEISKGNGGINEIHEFNIILPEDK